MSDVVDHNWWAPGQPAEVDYQGWLKTCVLHAVAKAFCDGCEQGKWSGGITFDAHQHEVVSSLMALFLTPGRMWPHELNGKIFEVVDKKSQFMGKFKVKVKTYPKTPQKSFQWLDQNEYYVLTYNHPNFGSHCVYVKTYNKWTGTFACMNSWGQTNQPRPQIDEADVIQVDMIEFELIDSSFKQKLDDEKRHSNCLSTASSNCSFLHTSTWSIPRSDSRMLNPKDWSKPALPESDSESNTSTWSIPRVDSRILNSKDWSKQALPESDSESNFDLKPHSPMVEEEKEEDLEKRKKGKKRKNFQDMFSLFSFKRRKTS